MPRPWMRVGRLALAMAVAGLASARAQTFTPARDELVSARVVTMESVEAWAEELLSLNPEVTAYEVVGPGHLVATNASGGQINIFLDNVLDRLSVRGAERSRVLAEHEAGLYDALALAAAEPEALPENIMPIVRHRDFLAAVAEAGGASDDPAEQVVHRALAGDTVVLLAYDTPSSIALMSKAAMGVADMSDEDALALALENLARRAAPLEWVEDGALRVALLDGNYESSLLLLDEVWSDLEAELGGEVAVAVPLRGLLVAGRADRADDVAALRRLIEDSKLDPYAVSEDVLVRRNRVWVVLR